MKVSPIAQGSPRTANPNEGVSANPERLARAKAIAIGKDPEAVQTNSDPQVERTQNSIKRLKMRTQVSTNRHEAPIEAVSDVPVETTQAVVEEPKSDILEPTEQATATTEETKPLSPQFAALAKQKRALQIEREQIAKERRELEASKTNDLSGYISKAELKAAPLKHLLSEGVTYDQLTEEILASNQDNEDITALRSELKALKEGFETQLKDRDVTTENQVKAQIKLNVEQLIATGDDFEMVREAGYAPKVVDLIDRVWKTEGILMDEAEAAATIEKELLEESLKFARIKKVQSRLNPTPTEQKQPVQTDRPGTKVMRTLTNRDGASSLSMSKRERAIAAMEGRLK